MDDVRQLPRRRTPQDAPGVLDAAPGTLTPAALLARYSPGHDAFWSAPSGTLLAQGVTSRVELAAADVAAAGTPGRPDPRADAVADEVVEHLHRAVSDGAPGLVVGALPFSPAGPVSLVVPRALLRAPGRLRTAGLADAVAPGAVTRETPVPAEGQFRDAVARALDLLEAGRLDKVVLARALDVRTAGTVDVAALVSALAAHDDEARLFAVDLPRSPGGGPRTLVGASPELLVARHGGQVRATPLAGSAARHPDPELDAAGAQALLASDKDRREHELVVEALVEALGSLCHDVFAPAEPTLVATPTVWHLATQVTATVADPRTTALHLARAVHPTPAVGGVPTTAAQDAIARLEPVDRGFYAGAVGWCDAAGDGEWAVSIRCGVVEGDAVRLHAGAGIVRGSDPDAELAETSAKLATLRSALGPALGRG